LLVLLASGAELAAQRSGTSLVRVIDEADRPIPYALVQVGKTAPRIANDSGHAVVVVRPAPSLEMSVRRLGYREFRGAVERSADGDEYVVRLSSLVPTLERVVVDARAASPLARTGFYDRVERVQRGAIVGEFITPEELEERNPVQMSDAVIGSRSVRVRYLSARRIAVLTGRGGCAMTILVDKMRVNNSAQDVAREGDPTSISNLERTQRYSLDYDLLEKTLTANPSIDALVAGREIMAIEMYTSMANAPAELIQLTGGGSCGLVAIWTGPRK
jgi:hypothetical protein